MLKQKTKQGYYLRLETGEEVVSSLEEFVRANAICMASFTMIGAVSHAELGYYVLSEKQYHWKEFDGEFEILGGTGNIAMRGEAPVVHLHSTFSGSDFSAFGGHVRRATVATTCEIVMTVEYTKDADGKSGILKRSLSEDTGLYLWDCV